MTVDFSKVRLVPIASVLAHYRVEIRKRSNTELVATCPFPSHKDAEHQKGTLAISLQKNRFYCHSDTCRAASNKPKGGDAIDIVAMMENLTPLDAAKKLAELFCVGEGGRAKETPSPSAAASSPEANRPLAFTLQNLDPAHPFIAGRGITAETAKEYGVGFFPGKGSMANRVVFPLYEVLHADNNASKQSSLIGYAGRTVEEATAENPKWKLPAGLVRSFLYGLEKCDPAKPLVLVESCWAVLWLFQHGQQAVALLGSSLTDEQEKRLAPFNVITVAMDNDEPGHAAAEKIAAKLRPKHKVLKAYLVE